MNLDEIVAGNVFGEEIELVPHTGFHGAAAVAEFHAEIGFAGVGIANFLFVNQEKGSNRLVGGQIFDEGALHDLLLPKRRSFLWVFFSLVASGVVLTSSISAFPPPAMS